MTHSKTEKYDVDIYKCPTAELINATQLTLGDLHANAMFLMHFLVSSGVVKISDEQYNQLKDIYLKEQLEKCDIEKFNGIIEELEIDEKPLIRLMGDEICDRGQNDYFIFKILNKLKKSEVQIEIILSNHGIEFLIPFENKRKLHSSHFANYGISKSMDNMQTLIEQGVITKEEVDTLVNECYLPNLKLISYSLHNTSITLYSHAGIGLETIQALAQKFKREGVVYKDDTAEELAQLIEAINSVFVNHVKAKTVHTLPVNHANPRSYKNDPVTFLIWNRRYDILKRDEKHKGYSLYFVHGHDPHEFSTKNIFNMDNIYFKGVTSHMGTYVVLGSQINSIPKLNVTGGEDIDVTLFSSETVNSPAKKYQIDIKSRASRKSVDLVSSFYNELDKLEFKAQQLQKDGHTNAYISAMAIHSTLVNAFKILQKDEDDQKFNMTCTDVIAEERSELDKHRDWREILIDLTIEIQIANIEVIAKGFFNLDKSSFFRDKKEHAKIAENEMLEKPNQILTI
ncbi:Dot/Icm T4SS effector Wip [Legionella sp.]|uniref:Dot/Icm T4SS effector Wip n=1 Tax=Legionella sp. TaxID=459 RepID=UPI003C862826